MWDTGEVTSKLEMSDAAEEKYGAPQLTVHRADLLNALRVQLPKEAIKLGHRAEAIDNIENKPKVRFTNGATDEFDVLVGADGIHSLTRMTLFGPDQPQFTGLVSYRSVVDRANCHCQILMPSPNGGARRPTCRLSRFRSTGDARLLCSRRRRSRTGCMKSWTMPGDVEELRRTYARIPSRSPCAARRVRERDQIRAVYSRSVAGWSVGRVTLLGDACHPMVPFMAQGACMAIEDARWSLAGYSTVLGESSIAAALKSYENTRKERTARVQIGSRGNEWLREGGNADWVYGYDATSVSLEAA